MRQALDKLVELISEHGWEFPDAAWYVSNAYQVDQTQLELAYDEHS